MTDGTPADGPTRRLPTWHEFLAAQTGWPFLIKWVIVGTAPWLLINAFQAGSWGATLNWSAVIIVLTLSSAAHGWLLFGPSWRVLVWTGASLLRFGAGFGIGVAPYVLPIIQFALLYGIRARPLWWVGAAMAGLLFGLLYHDVAIFLAKSIIPWVKSTIGLGSRYVYLAVQQVSVISVLLIQGAALAWLMPPVQKASTVRPKP